MAQSSSSSSSGIGFTGALQILFIGLKLAHFISWSWWWVLSPMIVLTVIAIVLLLIAGVVAALE